LINPTTNNSNTDAATQLQPGNTGIGGTLPAGLADPNTLANLSEDIQLGRRNIDGLPFNSPTAPPPPLFVPPAAPRLPQVPSFPLITGGGGGLTGPGGTVQESALGFEEEEGGTQNAPNPPNTPQAQPPEEGGATLLDAPSPAQSWWALQQDEESHAAPVVRDFAFDEGQVPRFETAGWDGEDSKPDLASILTVLALPLLPPLTPQEGFLKDDQERVTGQWPA